MSTALDEIHEDGFLAERTHVNGLTAGGAAEWNYNSGGRRYAFSVHNGTYGDVLTGVRCAFVADP